MTKDHPRILLVEDEPDVCGAIQSYLGRRGYFLSITASGKEALALIPISKPDIVILDFTLNDLDGRDVLKKLRKKDKKTKIIVVTGQMLEDEDRQEIIDLGISEYLNKPVSLEDLECTINRILKRPVLKVTTRAKPQRKKKSTRSSGTHKLTNLLGIIRNKCENHALNVGEGIYDDKSQAELVKMSVKIMKEVIKTVDRASEEVEGMIGKDIRNE